MSAGSQGARIASVCVGPGGIPKLAVDAVAVRKTGLDGDGHRYHEHGGAHRAVCLFSVEDCDRLRRDAVPIEGPGAFGENLLIEGLDFERLAPGDRLRVGSQVLLEIHDVREPCKTLQTVDGRFPALMEGRSGFVCRVLEEGTLRPGQGVEVIPLTDCEVGAWARSERL